MNIEPTWKCLGCGAVCNSPLDEKPTPCSFCNSEEIVLYEEAPPGAPPDVYHD